MAFFITVLRALAAILITNSHYTGVYPSDIIANGGLIGDVLFFAISGYCLCDVKLPFLKWYRKRLWRIFVPVWIGTIFILLFGGYRWDSMKLVEWFIYPTYYHFVASIVLLYIPFYFTMFFSLRLDKEKSKAAIVVVMIGIAIVMLLVFLLFYDKTYYHIDVVREPFIRFLFFESMLLGAYFKTNDEKLRNSFSQKHILTVLLSCVLYFASKLLFSKNDDFSGFQIINQFLIFILLYSVFRFFMGLDKRLADFPVWIKKVITFVAKITLEIYIVQYALIEALRPFLEFPLNWFIITASILIAAVVLHSACRIIYKLANMFGERFARMRKKA